MAEQVVAVLDGEAGHPLGGRPGEVVAHGGLERLPVVHPGLAEVAGDQAHQVQALPELHAGGVVGAADQVARVVHVDVQVAAVPAPGRGLVQPPGLQLDLGGGPGPGRQGRLGGGELHAPGAGDGEGDGRDLQLQVVAVEQGPVVEVPLAQAPLGEPGAAAVVHHRPAARPTGPQPQPGPGGQLAARRRGPADGQRPGPGDGADGQLDPAGPDPHRGAADLDPGRLLQVGVEQDGDLAVAALEHVGDRPGPQPDPPTVQGRHDQAGGQRVGEAGPHGGGPVVGLAGEGRGQEPDAEPATIGLGVHEVALAAPVAGPLGGQGPVGLEHGRHLGRQQVSGRRVAAHGGRLRRRDRAVERARLSPAR